MIYKGFVIEVKNRNGSWQASIWREDGRPFLHASGEHLTSLNLVERSVENDAWEDARHLVDIGVVQAIL